MKVKFLSMLTAAALMTGVTSCNNDDDAIGGGNGVTKGEPTTMSISIKTPSVPGTYADDINATNSEVAMNSVTLLVYEKNAMNAYVLEQKETLNPGDFTLTSPDTYTSSTQISTTTGSKKIFVGMNLPSAVTLPGVDTPLSTLEGLILSIGAKGDLSVANQFAMFSGEATDKTLVAEVTPGTTPTGNAITVAVKRMVAKVTVQDGITRNATGDIESEGGWLFNLTTALGNSNKTSYLLQKRVGTAPNIVIQDANWDVSTWAAGDFFGINATTDYQALDPSTATVATMTPMYAPENTASSHRTDGNNLTYISVRAKYVPGTFCDGTGATKVTNTSTTTPESFWVVSEANGNIRYFNLESEADAYKLATAGSEKSAKYVDGLCYFRAYINKAASSDVTGSKVAMYDFLRNNYYKAVIKSIKAPGYPEDKGDVKVATTITVDVEVSPWAVVAEDHNL